MNKKFGEDIKKLNERHQMYLRLQNRLWKKIDKVKEDIRAMVRQCDHRYGNGKSAIKGISIYCSCEICGVADP